MISGWNRILTTELYFDMSQVANILVNERVVFSAEEGIWVDSTASSVYPLFEVAGYGLEDVG